MHTSVLIIGAGPTGLMMACQLSRMGISCIIVDGKKGPTRESRALVVQARSLEIYDQMGIAQKAIDNGTLITKIKLYGPRGQLAEVPFQDIGRGLSKFPQVLVFEQSKNEALLYEDLKEHGGDVMWECELISFSQTKEKVQATVKSERGATLEISADWMVAADGARSVVRRDLKLSFEGGTYEHIFYVADTALPTHTMWEHDGLSLYFSRKAFLGLFPMQGERRFRAIGALPKSYQNEHPEQFEEIAPLIEKDVKLPLHFEDTRWFSVYRLHHRRVNDFSAARIFLTGDAAHIHSPAGGQGMNTGLQDTYNLAWKLAFTIRGLVKPMILDSYQQERLPIAKRLMITTDRGFAVLNSDKLIPVMMRMLVVPYVFPLLARAKSFRQLAFRTISQIQIRYPKSILSRKVALGKLKTGMRLPYVAFDDGSSLYDKMKGMKFHLLILANKDSALRLKELFETGFSAELLETLILTDDMIRRKLGMEEPALMLIRPDNYIASVVPLAKATEVEDYLRSLIA